MKKFARKPPMSKREYKTVSNPHQHIWKDLPLSVQKKFLGRAVMIMVEEGADSWASCGLYNKLSDFSPNEVYMVDDNECPEYQKELGLIN